MYEGRDLSGWWDNYREGSWHWPLLLHMKGHSYVYGHVSLAFTTAYTPLLGFIFSWPLRHHVLILHDEVIVWCCQVTDRKCDNTAVSKLKKPLYVCGFLLSWTRVKIKIFTGNSVVFKDKGNLVQCDCVIYHVNQFKGKCCLIMNTNTLIKLNLSLFYSY